MITTRASLLLRIKNGDDSEAWNEFYEIYAPIVYGYAKARGLQHNDALEVQSECYEAIVKQISTFQYEKERSGFKAWLRAIVNRRVIDFFRKRKEVSADSCQIANLRSEEDPVDSIWEQQWKDQMLNHCFRLAQTKVSVIQYEAFRLLVEEEKSVAEVQDLTGLNPNQIYKAKGRVLSVIRNLYQTLDNDDEL